MTFRPGGGAGRFVAGAVFAGMALASVGCGRGWGPAAYGGLWAATAIAQIVSDAAQAAAATRRAEAAEAARDSVHAPVCDTTPGYPCYRPTGTSIEEARAHALTILNLVRADSGVGPVALDFPLSVYAQEGSKRVARDHVPHAHILGNREACPLCGEAQSDPAGYPIGAIEEQIDNILNDMLSEGPGGGNHDLLVDPRWHRLGVGVANADGPMYLTLNLAP